MTTQSQSPSWDAKLYDARHSFVWQRGVDMLELLAARRGERILDLGCGTGHLTARIAASGARIIGIDNSPVMIAEARKNYPALEFQEMDARHFSFSEPFDAVFSNAALHWIKQPAAVVRCVEKALKSGGRFVAEFGGKRNVQKLVTALRLSLEQLGTFSVRAPEPWYFPSVGEYSFLLERHGLEVLFARLFDRVTPLDDGKNGLRNWIRMFAGQFLAAAPEDHRDELIVKTEKMLRRDLFRDGSWRLDYRRLRIVAQKSGTKPAEAPLRVRKTR